MSDHDLIRREDALKALCEKHPRSLGAIATIAALPAVTVGVKPLVWCDLHKDGCTFVPREGFNAFDFAATIQMLHSEKWRYAGSIFPTLEAAKAAAQADYEARIRAALEPVAAPNLKRIGTGLYETQPTPDHAAIREAWEKAYWRMRSYAVHDDACKLNKPPRFDGPCSCGLTAALEEALALISKGATEPTEYERKVAQMKKDFPNGI